MPTLTFKRGEDQRCQTVDLDDGAYSVGRAGDCHIVVPDGSISRHHCVLLIHLAEVIVRDCGSHNGTFVDGVRVNGQRQLKPGQLLHLGAVEVRLLFQEGSDWNGCDDSCESAVIDLRRLEKSKATIPIPRLPIVIAPGVARPDETITGKAASPAGIEIEQPADSSRRETERAQRRGRDPLPWLGIAAALTAIAFLLVWLWRSS